MGKKSKRNRSKTNTSTADESRYAPPLRSGNQPETEENLQFADPFVEEYVEEDIIDDNCKPPATEDFGGGGCGPSEIVQAWNPLTGDEHQHGELEMDASAYKMHHAMTPEWPCLSFDFLRDDHGDQRTRFPHTLIAAIGTQAARADQNQLTLLRISDMAKMQVETDDDILGEELNREGDDGDDDDDSSSDEEVDLDPVMEHYSIPHPGGVNRVRVMPQNADIVATWSDTGAVNLFNVASIRQRFSVGYGSAASDPLLDIPTKPFFSYTKHTTEGFAIDWSPAKQGHLVTGDCDGSIHCWSPRPEGGYAVSPFYKNSDMVDAPSNSVEDLQWSPTEATVFSSAECNGYVRIFDTRAPNKAMLSHQIHAADVNVLSWNHLVSNLLATGGDDGTLAVWDLRHFKAKPTPLARFTPHKSPISSVEWHPVDESMLAATDDAGAYIYDLSVEEDDVPSAMTDENPDIPPQLLFVHCGSEQFKEVHWHPQISSCLMSTALTGFSVFIPSNL